MKHALSLAHDLVYNFEFYMGWYFSPAFALMLLMIAIAIGCLRRSHKPALIIYVAVVVLMCASALSQSSGLEPWLRYAPYHHS
jgi:hypothetical protein